MAYNDTPIRRKLMAMVLITSAVVVVLTCAAFLGYERLTFPRTAVRQLTTLGQITAASSTGALAFDTPHDAADILNALKAERHIRAAALYDSQGALFARYPADAPDGAFSARPQSDGFRFVDGRLDGYVPVIQAKGSQRLGTLYLTSDLEELYDRMRLYSGIACLAIAMSSLVAYPLSRMLQGQISRPILALAETAKAVSDRRDYSVRAQNLGRDELGLLTDAFNHMLEQIHEQNGALQQAYDDLRQTQQAITQQERLRAVGQMASGIAHDINNALSPALLYVESLLEREPNLSTRSRDYLVMVQRAVDDVAQTVGRLREFYRQREPQRSLAPVDLNRLIEQAAELTRARWDDMSQQRGIAIEMQLSLAPDLALALGIESEIREALINLIFNAVDAIAEGGAITIRTRMAARPVGRNEPVGPLDACVEITDTGAGMDEETKRRCMEPFFTTKGERGTGLGLAMVYGTLQRHNAVAEIDSVVGTGTTIRLFFSVAEDLRKLPEPGSDSPESRTRRHLLLVDDDAALLKSLRETLVDDGHEVTVASGGQAGIEAVQSAVNAGRPFDLVLTDLGMPQVDGRRVADAVKAVSPGTKVCLLTGWGHLMDTATDVPASVDWVLNKPPKLRELREVLAAVSPAAT
jgi:signal transduction histidine kinase/ActR/RegA family two-component response regulator